MSIERLDHPVAALLCGQGLDLPSQAARLRSLALPSPVGQAPLLLVALLWGHGCTDVVRQLEQCLDNLLADLQCTPAAWSPSQAVRQALAVLNRQLYQQRRSLAAPIEVHGALLLVQAGEVQLLQAGAIGLLRYLDGSLQSLAGRDGLQLGAQPELALVQQRLPLSGRERLLLAPQALLNVADLQALREACGEPGEVGAQQLLKPLLKAPGAVALVLPQAVPGLAVVVAPRSWPAPPEAYPGLCLDGWTLLAACPYGPPGRMFRARDEQGREALLCPAAAAADEAFWQREWAQRRSPVASLAPLLSSGRARRHAFSLLAAPAPGTRSLQDWAAAHGPLDGAGLLALLVQLIAAVRALQRRGMQGLWLDVRCILVDPAGRLQLWVEHAAVLPGVPRQPMPAQAEPLAPELRAGQALDGRADQFALAALAYWLLCGRWPEVARTDAPALCRYQPLAVLGVALPPGWDGVLARALAPRPEARFEALSEFEQALRQPWQSRESGARRRPRALWGWRMGLVLVLGLQLLSALWLSLLLG